MITRAIKLRFRRHLRIQRRQVEELGVQAEVGLETHLFKRFDHLFRVRRFVTAWVLLMGILAGCVIGQMRGLSAFYQTIAPAPGGTYTEGILSPYTNINPIYASGLTDTSVSKLLFASLLTHDANNGLVGDLAESWTVDASERVYTVKLRPGLTWHDGMPLTADDVAFTYAVIQNPDAQSPLASSWQGIVVTAIDPLTVTFALPGALSAFPQSLTTGILPKHILGTTSMAAMRTAQFNSSQPIGSGPFTLKALEVVGTSTDTREEHIALSPFATYHSGKPKLDSFIIRTFRSKDRLVQAFNDQEVNAMVGLTQLPAAARGKNPEQYSLPLAAETMSFFNMATPIFADKTVRQALVRATDTTAVIKALNYPTRPVTQPFLMGQLGYSPAYAQASFDPVAANAMLDAGGWIPGKDGIRYKDKQPLKFSLVAQDSEEYTAVARLLQKQWRSVGAAAEVTLRTGDEFQSALAGRSYDVLLYGISVGADPDVFVYWDGAQADIRAANRLNFSEYKSREADVALEAGRTRSDVALRKIKYQPFSRVWQADAPAIGLYQPRFYYVTRSPVYGLSENTINADTDRFKNVQNWMIRTVRVSQQ